MDYRDTLNLPGTSFKMKANLPQKEPMLLKRWRKEELYRRLQEKSEGRPLYILHDGPPYANGDIHVGHAFNKILKDVVLRSRRMAGFNAPYIPGWDCHGLPIEINVDKELGDKKKTIPVLAKRAACRRYADKWIRIQKKQFERLGVLGDWDNPYLTIDYRYEAAIAREFNTFLLNGAVVRSRKPVYWCSTCTTALAEAEVEYRDHTSPSIYVKFQAAEDLADIASELGGDRTCFVIWTTTPWTLPANLAVALHPDFTYAAVRVGEETWIIAEDLVDTVMAEIGITEYRVAATFPATGFDRRRCRHPFLDRTSLLILADHVTADAGTGCVHTAPGHGADDFAVGLRYGLEILSPVDGEGCYTAEAGRYQGRHIPEVNDDIIADLRATGALVFSSEVNHSYPHCWRCRQPVMYRATPQWFLAMEKNGLRDRALAEIATTTWTPSWGEKRIHSMVENRPDWCLSRQRSWGVPLTVISCRDCGEVVKSDEVVQRVDELFQKEGADAWFAHEVTDFLPAGHTCRCGSNRFDKEEDILDVWFDSGTSFAAVIEQRDELRSPADLYLEGSDQHRGWFQSSLLCSVGTRGHAPYKGVLTHGYTVDGEGRKMSKSVGNVIGPAEVIEKYGAEILRLWVTSEDYTGDVKVSDAILRQVSDSYRKIRNTIRYFLGNLQDFDPQKDRVAVAEMAEIDRWALAKFEELRAKVVAAYDSFEFHVINQQLNYFCGITMSSFYLDILKDRLYTEAANSQIRRAAQTTLYDIVSGLLRLISPILCFTSAEAWDSLHRRAENAPVEGSIFFTEFPQQQQGEMLAPEMMAKWERLLAVRSEITKALEVARRDRVIGHSLEAEVLLGVEGELAGFVEREWETIREISIISAMSRYNGEKADVVVVSEELANLTVAVRPATGDKCERCWMRSESVGRQPGHPEICARCARVLAEQGL